MHRSGWHGEAQDRCQQRCKADQCSLCDSWDRVRPAEHALAEREGGWDAVIALALPRARSGPSALSGNGVRYSGERTEPGRLVGDLKVLDTVRVFPTISKLHESVWDAPTVPMEARRALSGPSPVKRYVTYQELTPPVSSCGVHVSSWERKRVESA